MKFASLSQFTEELDRAAHEFLAEQGLADCQELLLHTEECPIHGHGCARVTYGMFRDHVGWRWTDPKKVVGEMLRTMMPRAETRA